MSPNENEFMKAPREINGYSYVRQDGKRVKVPDHDRHYWVRYVPRVRARPKIVKKPIDPSRANRIDQEYIDKGWITPDGRLTDKAPLQIMKGVTEDILIEMERDGIDIYDLWNTDRPVIEEIVDVTEEEVLAAEVAELLPPSLYAGHQDTRARERVESGVLMVQRFTPDNHRILAVQPERWEADSNRPVKIDKLDDNKRAVHFGIRGDKAIIKIDQENLLSSDIASIGEKLRDGVDSGDYSWDSENSILTIHDKNNAPQLIDYLYEKDVPMSGTRPFNQFYEPFNQPISVSSGQLEIDINEDEDYIYLPDSNALAYEMGRKLRTDSTVKYKGGFQGREELTKEFVHHYQGYHKVPKAFFLDAIPDLSKRFNARITVNDNRDWSAGQPVPLVINEEFGGLREYQQELVDLALIKGSGIIKAPTGSGKTEIGAAIIGETGKDAIWLTHTNNLVDQSEERLEQRLGMDVGHAKGGSIQLVDNPRRMDVNVMSVQSVTRAIDLIKANRRGERKFRGHDITPAKVNKANNLVNTVRRSRVMMFDEAHHLKAKNFNAIYHENPKAIHRYGLTATPYNRDDKDKMEIQTRMGRPFGKITTSWLIRHGFLARPRIKMISRPPTRVRRNDAVPIIGDNTPEHYIETGRALVRNPVYNHFIAKLTKKQTSTGDKNAFILVKEVEHAERIKKQLNAQGVPDRDIGVFASQRAVLDPSGNFQYVDGVRKTGSGRNERLVETRTLKKRSQSPTINNRLLQDFKDKKYPIMVAITGKAGEGIDIPVVDNVIIADGGKSYIQTVQKLGRGLRKPAGAREEVQVFDFMHPEDYLSNHSEERLDIYGVEEEFKIERVNYNEALNRFT